MELHICKCHNTLSFLTLKGKNLRSCWTEESDQSRPIKRFASKTVFSGLVVSWFLAASPIRRSPSAVKATYEGVMRFPWSLGIISTRPFLKTPTLRKTRKKVKFTPSRHLQQILHSPGVRGSQINADYCSNIHLVLVLSKSDGYEGHS